MRDTALLLFAVTSLAATVARNTYVEKHLSKNKLGWVLGVAALVVLLGGSLLARTMEKPVTDQAILTLLALLMVADLLLVSRRARTLAVPLRRRLLAIVLGSSAALWGLLFIIITESGS